MNEIGLNVCGSDKTTKWPLKNAHVPHKSIDTSVSMSHCMKESEDLENASDRMSCTLDAKHSKADLTSIAKNVKMLSPLEQEWLKKALCTNKSHLMGLLVDGQEICTNHFKR